MKDIIKIRCMMNDRVRRERGGPCLCIKIGITNHTCQSFSHNMTPES